MKQFPIRSNHVSLAVTEIGGHLSDVIFRFADGRQDRPMHTAPWANETLPEDTPPILRVLRGDFFCAPFGSSDVVRRRDAASMACRPTAVWRLERSNGRSLDAVLDGTVIGATVTKHVELRDGRSRRLSAPHDDRRKRPAADRLSRHAARRDRSPARIQPVVDGADSARPVETPPGGRSMLATRADHRRPSRRARLAEWRRHRPHGLSDARRLRTICGCSLSDRTRDLRRGRRRHAPKAAGCGSD